MPSEPHGSCDNDHTRNTLVEIRPRCFSRGKQEWRYTSRYKRSKSTTRARPVAHSPSNSGSSSGSQPPSPVFAYHPQSRSRSPGRAPIELNETIPDSMQLLTWNVEAFEPNAKTRLAAILKNIQETIFGCPDGEQPEPCCILLQEVSVRSLSAILEDPWVREHFVVVPTTPEHWPQAHHCMGNVTLVARTIPVIAAYTLEFLHSPLKRHAVVVDVRLGVSTASESDNNNKCLGPERTLRIANVHLESLARGTQYRPWQLRTVADTFYHSAVHAGIVAGDMNAILPQDWELPAYVGLQDAWVGDDDGRGNTWGYQPPSKEFLPGRLDKVLYLPNGVCEVDRPERVGVGVKTALGQWASDHFGLLTSVRLLP